MTPVVVSYRFERKDIIFRGEQIDLASIHRSCLQAALFFFSFILIIIRFIYFEGTSRNTDPVPSPQSKKDGEVENTCCGLGV